MYGVPDKPLPGLGTPLEDRPVEDKRFPGLVGPMPQRFTPTQTAEVLAGLKANQPEYLVTDAPRKKPFTIGEVASDNPNKVTKDLMWSGGPQSRGEAAMERQSIADQIARAEASDAERIAEQDRQLAEEKARRELLYQADKAARDQAFFDQYGVEPSPQAMAEVVKHNYAAAKAISLSADIAALDRQEQEAIGKDPMHEAEIRKAFEEKRRLRLILPYAAAGTQAGSALGPEKPAKPQTAAEAMAEYLAGAGQDPSADVVNPAVTSRPGGH